MSDNQSPHRFCRSPRDFEEVAVEWLRHWGFGEVRTTANGPDDGVDAESTTVVAQVKAWMTPIGISDIQRLKGAAFDGRQAVFFSLSSYTSAALAFANKASIALFRYVGYDGSVEPVNASAQAILEGTQSSELLTGAEVRTGEPIHDLLLDAITRLCTSSECDFVIVDVASTGRYIQFAVQHGELLGESVSDDYIQNPEIRHTTEQLAALEELGWQQDAGSSGNYCKYWRGNSSVADAAAIGAATLVRVHEVRGIQELRIKYGD